MVNFKAGAHQGERKRAQATQGDDGANQAISKLEKMKLRPDALVCVNPDGVPLRVAAREKVFGGESNAHVKAALVAQETLDRIAPGATRAFMSRPGGDMVLTARVSDKAAVGEVLLGEAQRLSCHVCEDEFYEWVPFQCVTDGSNDLASLSIEAQLLHTPAPGAPPVEMDAVALGRAIGKRLFDELVSNNEIFIFKHEGTELVLRVTDCAMPEPDDDDEAEDGDGSLDEPMNVGDEKAVRSGHCFRGLVSARTVVYAGPSTVFASSASQRAVCAGLRLTNVQAKPERPPRNVVHVLTSDGEMFPVHRRLLKPCIALTKAVRDTTAAQTPEASIGVDCATFDRTPPPCPSLRHAPSHQNTVSLSAMVAGVLLYLEAEDRGKASEHLFDMQSLPDLASAANALQCRTLRESCAKKLGAFEERITVHRWADVVRHNDAVRCRIQRSSCGACARAAHSRPPVLRPARASLPDKLARQPLATSIASRSHLDRISIAGRLLGHHGRRGVRPGGLAARAPWRRDHHPAAGAQSGLHGLLRAVPRLARVVHVPARVLHRRASTGGAGARALGR